MTQNEIKNIGIHVSILMETILDNTATAEETANTAITFAKQFLREFPQIKEVVGDFITSFDENDPHFNRKWDISIEWIKNWDKMPLNPLKKN